MADLSKVMIVVVEWEDAVQENFGWRRTSEYINTTKGLHDARFVTVGNLIEANYEYILVALSIKQQDNIEGHHSNSAIKIPLENIRSINFISNNYGEWYGVKAEGRKSILEYVRKLNIDEE